MMKKDTTIEDNIAEAIRLLKELQARHKSSKPLVSNYIIKMRDERIKKWMKIGNTTGKNIPGKSNI